jgi:peptidoglycan/LPS O-acetylase OafA/YrhL
MENTGTRSRIGCLDGLRGLAALWVMIGHALLIARWDLPPLSIPDLAVDLFMILSGFLMTYHYVARRQKEPWQSWTTWARFWARRFFRIAPVYYLLLAVALLLNPWLRSWIAFVNMEAGGDVGPHLDLRANIALHASFLFGMIPEYSYGTSALPDWSIGLEMQFYVAFPVVFLLIARLGMLPTLLALTSLCAAAWVMFPDFLGSFEKPSFLPLKFAMFASGMLIAAGPSTGAARRASMVAALLLPLVPAPTLAGTPTMVARLILAGTLIFLVRPNEVTSVLRLDRLAHSASRFLGTKPFSVLGDLSYGVYLVHLLIMYPVMGLVVMHAGRDSPAPIRAGLCLLLTAPATYGVAWLLHRFVERPGIVLGRRTMEGMWGKPTLSSPAMPPRDAEMADTARHMPMAHENRGARDKLAHTEA